MNVVVDESEVPNTPGFDDLPSDSSDPNDDLVVAAVVIDRSSEDNTRSGFSTPKRQKSVVVDDESPCSKRFKSFYKRVLDRNEKEKEKEKMKEKERVHAIEKKMKEHDKKGGRIGVFVFHEEKGRWKNMMR
ncbi:uncharacterized protein LOC141595822 [Silene latifolia]|uniref:uncharacterized protein LOC141595822 n=1 Tax=Silene latifolia TaxID=37657 RepID=UPI003D78516E